MSILDPCQSLIGFNKMLLNVTKFLLITLSQVGIAPCDKVHDISNGTILITCQPNLLNNVRIVSILSPHNLKSKHSRLSSHNLIATCIKPN